MLLSENVSQVPTTCSCNGIIGFFQLLFGCIFLFTVVVVTTASTCNRCHTPEHALNHCEVSLFSLSRKMDGIE